MSTTRPGRPALWSAGRAPAAARSRRSLQIGPAAERWLMQRRGGGHASGCRRKMAEAVDLSKLHGAERVNRALETCAQRWPVR